MERRKFLRNTFGISALALVHPQLVHAATKRQKVRIGILGTGMRGRSLLGLFLDRADVEVTALCDIDVDALNRAQQMIFGLTAKTPDFALSWVNSPKLSTYIKLK